MKRASHVRWSALADRDREFAEAPAARGFSPLENRFSAARSARPRASTRRAAKGGWVVATLWLLFGAACAKHEPAASVDVMPPLRVSTAVVTSERRMQTFPVTGIIRPQARATVAAKVLGSVARADFKVGQPVAAGDVLVVLSAGELDARLARAEAELAQARRDLERETRLLATGASTAEEVHALEERQRMAEAAVAEMRTLRAYTQIAAPFAGVVTRKYVNEGDLAAPGTALFDVEGTDRLWAEVNVPEDLPAVEMRTRLRIETATEPIEGTLVEYSPAADTASRTRFARVEVPAHAPVRSGEFVRVRWPSGEAPWIGVPARAVLRFGQMERVFVVADGRAQLRLVRTGAAIDDTIEVLSGLSAHERVVVAPPANLRDGARVEFTP